MQRKMENGKIDKFALKKEVEHAIMMAEELKHDAPKIDFDDIEDYAARIQMTLKRVMKELLS